MNSKHFEALRQKYGDHSKAARALGTSPSHYRHVRATGKASAALKNLIAILGDEPTPQPPEAA